MRNGYSLSLSPSLSLSLSLSLPHSLPLPHTHTCTQKKADVTNVLRTVKNKMILFVGEVCGCIFDTRYVSPMHSKCSPDINTPLELTTNITVPYSQNYNDFVQHFNRWIKTVPTFTQTLSSGAVTKVTIVQIHLDTNKPTFRPPEVVGEGGSGEPTTPGVVNITVERPDTDEINSSAAVETSIFILTAAFLLSHLIVN